MAGAIVTAHSDIHHEGSVTSKMIGQFIDADRINHNLVETKHMFGGIAVVIPDESGGGEAQNGVRNFPRAYRDRGREYPPEWTRGPGCGS